jgi:hypothetical protein
VNSRRGPMWGPYSHFPAGPEARGKRGTEPRGEPLCLRRQLVYPEPGISSNAAAGLQPCMHQRHSSVARRRKRYQRFDRALVRFRSFESTRGTRGSSPAFAQMLASRWAASFSTLIRCEKAEKFCPKLTG